MRRGGSTEFPHIAHLKKEGYMARRIRFGAWCRKNLEDTTKIVYTFRMKECDGREKTMCFTSDILTTSGKCGINMH